MDPTIAKYMQTIKNTFKTVRRLGHERICELKKHAKAALLTPTLYYPSQLQHGKLTVYATTK